MRSPRIYRDEPRQGAAERRRAEGRLKPQRRHDAGGAAAGGDARPSSRARLVQAVDPMHGGIGGAPKFPQAAVASSCCGAPARASALPHPLEAVDLTLDAYRARRHLRSPRRRLRALLRRRALARAAFREDALRQRAADRAAWRRPGRRAASRRSMRSASPRRSPGCCARCVCSRAGALRPQPRRRQRGRGGQVLCLDARPRSTQVLGAADAARLQARSTT